MPPGGQASLCTARRADRSLGLAARTPGADSAMTRKPRARPRSETRRRLPGRRRRATRPRRPRSRSGVPPVHRTSEKSSTSPTRRAATTRTSDANAQASLRQAVRSALSSMTFTTYPRLTTAAGDRSPLGAKVGSHPTAVTPRSFSKRTSSPFPHPKSSTRLVGAIMASPSASATGRERLVRFNAVRKRWISVFTTGQRVSRAPSAL